MDKDDPISRIQNKRAADAAAKAESDRTQSIIDAVKSSGGETKDSLSSAMHDILMATLIGKDPKLAEVASNLAELIESIRRSSDNFKTVDLEVIPDTFSKLLQAMRDLPAQVAETDKSESLIPYLEEIAKSVQSKDLSPTINAPEVNLKPLETLIKSLEKAIKESKVEIPKSDMSELENAVRSVERAVTGLVFPTANYILPFRDINGKAVQVQLDSNGNIPTTGGGGGGGGNGAILDFVNSAVGANVVESTANPGTYGLVALQSDGDDITGGGGGGGGTSSVDDSAFTAGTDSGTPIMGFATSDTVNSGDVGVLAMDVNRNLKVIGQANSGVDIGDVTINNASGASAVNIQDGGNSITVDGSVSLTGSLPAGTNNIGDVDVLSLPVGQQLMGASTPVVIASNQTTVKTKLATDLGATAGTITTSTSTVVATDLSGVGAATVQISGTYAGVNVTFEGTLDGTIWFTIPAQQATTATPTIVTATGVLTTNSTNVWNVAPLFGVQQFRVRATAYTSGTANVLIEPSAQFSQQIVSVASAPTTTVTGTVTANLGTGGTGATSLGKAEDAVAASGDTGVAVWGVRNDNAATAPTSANGDYSQLSVDANGALFNRPVPANTATTSNVAASATSVTVLAANAARRLAVFYNDSSSDCYVKFGTTASTSSFTIFLAALGSFSLNGEDYAGRIDAIWNSATGNMRVTETV